MSSAEQISLVVFLGNIGKKYEKTRHNASWLFARSLSFFSSLYFKKGFGGTWAKVSWPLASTNPERSVYFLMPETYMNLSGESVAALASFYKIPAKEILAVHDEIELDFGLISFKKAGGLGGHNGLRSLKGCLGTADFWRLRIGVGRPEHPDVAAYVLSDFTKMEMEALPLIFGEAENLLVSALSSNPHILLENYSKKKIL